MFVSCYIWQLDDEIAKLNSNGWYVTKRRTIIERTGMIALQAIYVGSSIKGSNPS